MTDIQTIISHIKPELNGSRREQSTF